MPGTASVRVLLVDDEELICRTLQRLLKQETRFEVHTANNYVEASRVFQTAGPFDLLVTDLQLYEMSGIELAKRFFRRDPNLRVVFMSGAVPRAAAAQYHTIEKPFDRDALLRALESALLAPVREFE